MSGKPMINVKGGGIASALKNRTVEVTEIGKEMSWTSITVRLVNGELLTLQAVLNDEMKEAMKPEVSFTVSEVVEYNDHFIQGTPMLYMYFHWEKMLA